MGYNDITIEEAQKILERLGEMIDSGKIEKSVFRYIMLGVDKP